MTSAKLWDFLPQHYFQYKFHTCSLPLVRNWLDPLFLSVGFIYRLPQIHSSFGRIHGLWMLKETLLSKAKPDCAWESINANESAVSGQIEAQLYLYQNLMKDPFWHKVSFLTSGETTSRMAATLKYILSRMTRLDWEDLFYAPLFPFCFQNTFYGVWALIVRSCMCFIP